jgi:hypothetical protein
MTVITSVSTGSSVQVLVGSGVSVGADELAVSVGPSAIVPSPSSSSGVQVDDEDDSVAEALSLGTSVGEAVSVAVGAALEEEADGSGTVAALNGASVTWKSAAIVLGFPPAFWMDD